MVNFNITKKDCALIEKAAKRAVKLLNCVQVNRLGIEMDLTATHVNGCELDLEKLLTFDDYNFAHDVVGIVKHIDRNTGELLNCFLPRCSK